MIYSSSLPPGTRGLTLGFSSDGVVLASASHMLKTEFINANTVVLQSEDEVSTWNADSAPAFSQVTYPGLWDGVTLVYTASPGSILKSAYYIDGAGIAGSVSDIRLHYNRPVSLDSSGNLVTVFDTGAITEGNFGNLAGG